MAILAFVCVQYPDTQLGIIFIPTLTFSAGAVSIFFKEMWTRIIIQKSSLHKKAFTLIAFCNRKIISLCLTRKLILLATKTMNFSDDTSER